MEELGKLRGYELLERRATSLGDVSESIFGQRV